MPALADGLFELIVDRRGPEGTEAWLEVCPIRTGAPPPPGGDGHPWVDCPACPPGSDAGFFAVDGMSLDTGCFCRTSCRTHEDCASVPGAICRPRFPDLNCEIPCGDGETCPSGLTCATDSIRGVSICAAVVEG
ncbi:MAG: hypothetical protein ACFCGT_00560 [Sandaracinaceae bacterium]